MGKEKRFRQSLFMRKKKPVLANTKLFRLLYDYTQIPPFIVFSLSTGDSLTVPFIPGSSIIHEHPLPEM